MDNFNYQAYIKSGRIHQDKAILNESEQVSEKKHKNKGNKENVEEAAPGFLHDCAAHVMHESHGYGLCLEGRHTLVETTKGNAEVTHYDVMFKSGNIVEKIPVNELKVLTSEAHHHGKEEKDLEEVGKGYFKKEHGVGKKGFKMDKRDLKETIAEAKAKIDEGSYPFDQCLADNEGKYGKKGAARVCGAIRAAYGEGLVNEMDEVSWNDKNNPTKSKEVGERDPKKVGQSTAAYSVNEGLLDFLKKKKKEAPVKKDDPNPIIGVDYDGNYIRQDGTMAESAEFMEENKRTDAEQEGYKDGFEDAKDDIEAELKKMKVSELKAKIKEDIISVLSEQEDVDVDVDVEDEVTVDAEGDDIEIEKKAVKAKVQVGLSPEEEIVQDSLKAAMDAAQALGSQKLADQIGNTITFFTREFVVGNNTD